MIQLNNTESRQNVKPLTNEELSICVNRINRCWTGSMEKNEFETLQSFVDSYQNLQHFWDVVGGWEGLDKIKGSMYDKGIQDGFIKGVEAGKNIK